MSEIKNTALSIRQALWNFQKELLTSLKSQYEHEVGYEANPTEWFRVLTTADRYTWLKELTSIMADIDVLTELEAIDDSQLQIIKFEIERLIYNDDPNQGLLKYIRPLLMGGANLLPLYTLLKANLKKVALTESISTETAQEARKQWQVDHQEQRRKNRM